MKVNSPIRHIGLFLPPSTPEPSDPLQCSSGRRLPAKSRSALDLRQNPAYYRASHRSGNAACGFELPLDIVEIQRGVRFWELSSSHSRSGRPLRRVHQSYRVLLTPGDSCGYRQQNLHPDNTCVVNPSGRNSRTFRFVSTGIDKGRGVKIPSREGSRAKKYRLRSVGGPSGCSHNTLVIMIRSVALPTSPQDNRRARATSH